MFPPETGYGDALAVRRVIFHVFQFPRFSQAMESVFATSDLPLSLFFSCHGPFFLPLEAKGPPSARRGTTERSLESDGFEVGR